MKYIKAVVLFALLQAQIYAMHEIQTYKVHKYDSYEFDKKTATPTSKNSSVDGYESDNASLAEYIKNISNKFISSKKNDNVNHPGRYIESTSSQTKSSSKKLPKITKEAASESLDMRSELQDFNSHSSSPTSVIAIYDSNQLLPKIEVKNIDTDVTTTPQKSKKRSSRKKYSPQEKNIAMDHIAKWLENNGGENYIEAARVSPNFVEYQSFLIEQQPLELNDATTIPEVLYQPARPTAPKPTTPSSSRQRPPFLGGRLSRTSN